MSHLVLRYLAPSFLPAVRPTGPATSRPSVLLRVQQRVCAATRGHELMRSAHEGRLRLVCRECLYETKGVQTGKH